MRENRPLLLLLRLRPHMYQERYLPEWKDVGKDIIPNLEVNPTLSDYLQHKDVVLDKAVSLLQKKVK